MGDHELVPARIAEAVQIGELLALVGGKSIERITAAARLRGVDHAIELSIAAQQALHIEHRAEADGRLAAYAGFRTVLLDVSAAHEGKRARIDVGAILEAQGRAAAAAASAPDVGIFWLRAIYA